MSGKKISTVFTLLALCLHMAAQPAGTRGGQAEMLIDMLENYHYSPPENNVKLSNRIFDQFIKTLDPYALLFTNQSVEGLSAYRDSICTMDARGLESFISEATGLYHNRLLFADSIADACFLSPFDFTSDDSLQFPPHDSLVLSPGNTSLAFSWRKWVKSEMLRSLSLSLPDSLKTLNLISDTLYAPGSQLAQKVKTREKRRLSQLLNYSGGFENFVQNVFLNCITANFDPHSAFFSANDKEKFESSLSRDNFAFGFELDNNLKEEVVISRVLPESPAWVSKKIEKGDVLMKIKMPGQDETDLAFASLDEINTMLESLNGDKLELTVKKADGKIKTVSLHKGKFDARENLSLSFVLEGEKKIGYIWFSGFYTEFGRMGNKGCSSDVLKEIVKMKEDSVCGIILDLRNNPGGSEYEATEIAGYFTGNGPLATRMNKDRRQEIIKTGDSEAWYDGPLVVLVNGASASAAELLSASLQDYHRAVIVGGNTFGKASEQLVFPLGKKYKQGFGFQQQKEQDYGFAKITTGKIFRITGKSYQKDGVSPDVRLPGLDSIYRYRESELPCALENDSVIPEIGYTPLPCLPVDSLAARSRLRVEKNEKFRQMKQLAEKLKFYANEERPVPLNISKYLQQDKEISLLMPLIENYADTDSAAFTARNASFDEGRFESGSPEAEINELFKSNVQKDIYIDEACRVLLDLAGFSK